MKKFFGKAQQFGKSFMLPIAILPAAGLLLGIGVLYPIQIQLMHIQSWTNSCSKRFLQ